MYIAFGESSSIDEGRCRNQLLFESHILTFKNFDSLTSADLIFQSFPSENSLFVKLLKHLIAFEFHLPRGFVQLLIMVQLDPDCLAVHCFPDIVEAQIHYFFL